MEFNLIANPFEFAINNMNFWSYGAAKFIPMRTTKQFGASLSFFSSHIPSNARTGKISARRGRPYNWNSALILLRFGPVLTVGRWLGISFWRKKENAKMNGDLNKVTSLNYPFLNWRIRIVSFHAPATKIRKCWNFQSSHVPFPRARLRRRVPAFTSPNKIYKKTNVLNISSLYRLSVLQSGYA